MGSNSGANVPPERVHDSPDGYRNLTRIDQGGFAVVYRALDTRFDRTVALKILRSDSLDERRLRRFSAECLAIGRVSSHPNIVTVYDAGTTAGQRPWLAMEYCSGGSLAHKVARTGPLPVTEVISIGARLCDALAAAHGAGILHRDVKPANVLLTSYGEPALADFGIASVRIDDDPAHAMSTETGAYTVVHAAPEILGGEAGGAAADIYSLGSTLYTLLAGQAPFAAEASAGLAPLVTRILRNDVPVIARHGVPPELEALLRTAMAARPQDRPASAAELGARLAALGQRLAAGKAPGRAVSRARRAGQAITARRLLVILGSSLAVLLAVFMTWGFAVLGSGPHETGTNAAASTGGGASRADDRYTPQAVTLAQGQRRGELILTWRMPIRPDVVATVIYQGSGTTRARAVVTYGSGRRSIPEATVRGLPSGRQVCLSAAHVVSTNDRITSAVSRPVCALPR